MNRLQNFEDPPSRSSDAPDKTTLDQEIQRPVPHAPDEEIQRHVPSVAVFSPNQLQAIQMMIHAAIRQQGHVEDKAMSACIASFKSAYEQQMRTLNPDIVEFSVPFECTCFDLKSTSNTYRYLIQPQYYDLWNLCVARRFQGDDANRSQTVIVGTAGIGKSAARLLYICMWLKNETPSMAKFDKVIFNFNNDFFVVDKNGLVALVNIVTELKSSALMLLDPCDYLNNAQSVACSMLIVFASPSSLLSHPGKPNLSGLSKRSKYYVMEPPTVEAMQSLNFTYDAKRLENFSWEKDGRRYCSLRWFTFTNDEIQQKIDDCLTSVSRDGLWDWFVTNTTPSSKDYRLPFRLCVVESSQSSSWKVTRFISPAIEHLLSQWSMETGQRQAHQVANILQNRILKGGLGIYFETWLFGRLGAGVKLQISDSSSTEICFREDKIIPESSVGLEEGVFYKLDRKTFPSVEGYGIVGQNIYLLQSTVASTHDGARYKDVNDIVAAAVADRRKDGGGSLGIVIVYIAPSRQDFSLPTCVGFPNRAMVVRGAVDDGAFFGVVHKNSAGGGQAPDAATKASGVGVLIGSPRPRTRAHDVDQAAVAEPACAARKVGERGVRVTSKE